ncbi:hypothetical protein [Lentzea sp. NPDC003310]|uniref:hypothetical protein n=1 Tax=Lentzea sp. NPDC003310 TaxID=3154447 RepID=UPI0033A61078
MGFYVLVQPEEDARVEFVEHVQGHPALIISCGGSQITVQSPGRQDGPSLTIAFARQLGDAARLYADRLDGLTRLAPLDFESLAAQVGTTPAEVAERTESRHALRDDVWPDDDNPLVIEAGEQR